MTTGVWVAIITSLTSLAVAGITLVFQRKGAREEQEEKQRSDAKVVLDKYRGPLLAVASDLGRRIHHIRYQNFFVYTTSESGHDRQSKLTTLFRIAQYFGWCEILRTEVQLLPFESKNDTRLVAELIGAIHWACSSDAVDDGSRGSLWAEEQRGIGELMVERNEGSLSTCGYARFVDEYKRCFASWMDGIASFVLCKEAPDSHRLRLVQWGLFGLVNELDEEHAHTGEEEEEWMDRAREELYARQELYVQEKLRREREKLGKDSKPRLTPVEFNIIDHVCQAVDPRRSSRRGHRSREPVD